MMPQTRQQPTSDPWHDKGERLWLIGSLALLACLVFAAYDGQGFHARYLRHCTEQPASRECRPLNLVREERPPALDITLDFGKGKWAMAVGPRQEESAANELAARLRSAGAVPRIVRLAGKGKKAWYQVQVGRFPNRKSVNEAGAQLQAKGIVQEFSSVEYQAVK